MGAVPSASSSVGPCPARPLSSLCPLSKLLAPKPSAPHSEPLPPVPAPAPGPQVSRERRAPSRRRPCGPRCPERARRPHARHARPAGPAFPAVGLPAPGRALSRELGVNSPEWRPEVCSPLRRRYPGPTGAELEAAAGTSGGRLPGAASPPPDRPRASPVSAGPGAPRAGVRRAVAGPSLRPWTRGARGRRRPGRCGNARHSDAPADATGMAVGSERSQVYGWCP